MIPLAVPIAFAVLALVAWRYDARARRAYEATLSAAEKRQFRALRRIRPSNWRAVIALKQAETAVTAAPDVEAREPKRKTRRSSPRGQAQGDKNRTHRRKSGKREEAIK